MTETEKKALALIDEARREHDMGPIPDYLCARAALIRAIEQHEAFRQEVSDAITGFDEYGTEAAWEKLSRFIIAKPDPLVEALDSLGLEKADEWAPDIRKALAARGLEVRKIGEGE